MPLTPRPLSVCLFGFAENPEDGRTWALTRGLKEHGVTLIECRSGAPGLWGKYRELYRTWRTLPRTDAVYVIFLGYYLMPLAWLLTHWRGIPLVLDALMSQYDTEVNDRKRLRPYAPRALFLWAVDYFAFALADVLVVDTEVHKRFFAGKFHVPLHKMIVAPMGCRNDVFTPRVPEEEAQEECVIEFHGSFIPLQGIEHIIRAAKLLQDKGEEVRFECIGSGQTYPEMERLAKEQGLTNLHFVGRRPQKDIPAYIARAQICLGIFGTTEKALRVIPNKVYECLSCGKAVITERSPAALETLHDGEDVCLVTPGNGEELAERISTLKHDAALRARLAEGARRLSNTTFSPGAIAGNLVQWLLTQS
jgi:glycosyltransferase involved in cell wall biosynthesis